MNALKYALVGVGTALAATLFAAPAHADDASFLASLEKRGISGYTTPQQALALGHWTCSELRRGRSGNAVYSDLSDYVYRQNHIYPVGGLGQLIGAAWNNLCLDQAAKYENRDIDYLPRGQRW